MVAVEHKKMDVTRYNQIGLGGDGCGDDLIIVGIRHDDPGNGKWSHQLNGIDIIRRHFVGGTTDQRQSFCGDGAYQHLSQFRKQRSAGEELDTVLMMDRFQLVEWRATP